MVDNLGHLTQVGNQECHTEGSIPTEIFLLLIEVLLRYIANLFSMSSWAEVTNMLSQEFRRDGSIWSAMGSYV